MAATLWIRADAGHGTGTGHVMRQIALARAWQAAGGRARLVSHCPSQALRKQIRAAGVALVPLEHRHPHPADLSSTLSKLDAHRKATSDGYAAAPTWVVLDGYHFDPDYQQAIRQTGCRLLAVDDMAHLAGCHADLLLNQNLGAERLAYQGDERTTFMLGPRYVLLRPEFPLHKATRRDVPETARNVLITLGGEDPDNVTRLAVQAMEGLDLPGLEGRIVVGPANPHLERLRDDVRRSPVNLRLLTDVTDMPGLMAWADAALAAAGTTCFELAFMKLPAVVVVLADNQQTIAAPLAEAGAVVNLGPAGELTAEAIADALDRLCRDRPRRLDLAGAGRRLVDGHGAERVMAVMKALDGPIPDGDLTVRPITLGDLHAVWRLANTPSVRRYSLSPDPIPLDSHVRWFHQKLSSPDTCTWALDLHGLLIGQIRYDRVDPSTAEISYSVAAAFRGRGLGRRLLERTFPAAGKQLHVKRFRAKVRPNNAVSARIFARAGFAQAASERVCGHTCHIFERAS